VDAGQQRQRSVLAAMRYLLKRLARCTFLRRVGADMRAAEVEIHASHLDWTILRPPRLTGKPAAGTYRTTIDRNLPRGYTISRVDLAACVVTLLGTRPPCTGMSPSPTDTRDRCCDFMAKRRPRRHPRPAEAEFT
jgi:hypothetical protein